MPVAYPRYVIPPYILRRIVDHGSLQQQRCAQNTLSHVQSLMAHVPGRPAAPHVTTPGQLERDIYDAGQTQELPGTQVRFEGSPPTVMWPLMKPMTISASPMSFSGRATSAILWITAG